MQEDNTSDIKSVSYTHRDGGDGIGVKGVENTIRNVGTLASEGMRETDRTIIRLMTSGMC